MPVNAGQLRENIDIQTCVLATANETGEQTETWTSAASRTRAEVKSLSGSEAFRAKQVHADATYQVRIRYDSTVNTNQRIAWGDLFLYPISITNDSLNREMIILCKQTASN